MLTRSTFVSGLPLAFSAAAAVCKLTKEDDQFLEDLAHRCFRFFWEQADANTGLVRDRALADTWTPDPRPWASSAATGFGLTALSIAAEWGWLPRSQVSERVLTRLRYFAETAIHEHGWFYHFVNSATGARRGTTEVSDIDTALLLAGVVTVQEYFHGDAEVGRLAPTIWDRIDFRHRPEKREPRTNWFENSVEATLAHRQFCINLKIQFPGYSETVWGISASDSAHGYHAWGGPPATKNIDGTVVPCAAGGSLLLAPEVCLPALMEMRRTFGDRIYKRYGFVDAFHPNNGWTDPDVIVIDVGITLLSAENLRTGNVWKWFMRKRQIQRVMAELFV